MRVRICFDADLNLGYYSKVLLPVPAELNTVSDFIEYLMAAFGIQEEYHGRLWLALDEYLIPPNQRVTDVLREDDVVDVLVARAETNSSPTMSHRLAAEESIPDVLGDQTIASDSGYDTTSEEYPTPLLSYREPTDEVSRTHYGDQAEVQDDASSESILDQAVVEDDASSEMHPSPALSFRCQAGEEDLALAGSRAEVPEAEMDVVMPLPETHPTPPSPQRSPAEEENIALPDNRDVIVDAEIDALFASTGMDPCFILDPDFDALLASSWERLSSTLSHRFRGLEESGTIPATRVELGEAYVHALVASTPSHSGPAGEENPDIPGNRIVVPEAPRPEMYPSLDPPEEQDLAVPVPIRPCVIPEAGNTIRFRTKRDSPICEVIVKGVRASSSSGETIIVFQDKFSGVWDSLTLADMLDLRIMGVPGHEAREENPKRARVDDTQDPMMRNRVKMLKALRRQIEWFVKSEGELSIDELLERQRVRDLTDEREELVEAIDLSSLLRIDGDNVVLVN